MFQNDVSQSFSFHRFYKLSNRYRFGTRTSPIATTTTAIAAAAAAAALAVLLTAAACASATDLEISIAQRNRLYRGWHRGLFPHCKSAETRQVKLIWLYRFGLSGFVTFHACFRPSVGGGGWVPFSQSVPAHHAVRWLPPWTYTSMAASMDLHLHGCLHGPTYPWLPPWTYISMAASVDLYIHGCLHGPTHPWLPPWTRTLPPWTYISMSVSVDLHIQAASLDLHIQAVSMDLDIHGCLRGPTYPWLPRSVQCEPVWPSGKAGKRQRDLGSNPLRLSFPFKDYGLWTLS